MIRIDRHEEIDGTDNSRPNRNHGVWEYSCPQYPRARGYSRQPLLDACRQLTTLYRITGQAVGVFHAGAEVANIFCSVDRGAALTVRESGLGAPRFVEYTPAPRADLSRIRSSSDWSDYSFAEGITRKSEPVTLVTTTEGA
jgi:hypothetical protein